MEKVFKTVEGNQVSNLRGIREGYCVEKRTGNRFDIRVNVSAENIDVVFRKLCAAVRTPGFLLLEHGTNANVEEILRNSDTAPLHKDIFYLDGLDFPKFLELYNEYADLLVNDGKINYGFGSHNGLDEVFIAPYKIFTIMTDDAEKYIDILKELGYRKYKDLKTVWKNFKKDYPGTRKTVTRNGIDIYEMVEQLKGKGLYLAERREE